MLQNSIVKSYCGTIYFELPSSRKEMMWRGQDVEINKSNFNPLFNSKEPECTSKWGGVFGRRPAESIGGATLNVYGLFLPAGCQG